LHPWKPAGWLDIVRGDCSGKNNCSVVIGRGSCLVYFGLDF